LLITQPCNARSMALRRASPRGAASARAVLAGVALRGFLAARGFFTAFVFASMTSPLPT